MTAPATLVGRSPELEQISEVLRGINGGGRAVVVHGDPGIGKSSLLRRVAELAQERRFLVVETTGIETEAGLPYAGLHRLLAPLLSELDRLPAVQARALLTALGLEDGAQPQLFMVALAALTLITESAAESPVIAIVDDLQWLDAPTNETLAFVARRVTADPVLILGAQRNGHASPWWETGFDEIFLGGLDDEASRELLEGTAPDLNGFDRETILRQAAGNPLALVELPLAWRTLDHVPGSAATMPLSARLERAFASRLPDLAVHTRAALLVAAVDHEDSVGEILAATGVLLGEPVTVEILAPALEAGLIWFDERRLTFRHPLVRSGVLHAESPSQRLAAHAALAEVLESQPYRRTWHRSMAIVGPDDAVADELEASHVESVRRGWMDAAIATLERSAELTTDSARRGRRLLLAAEHGFSLGRADLVDRLVTRADRNSLTELDRARVEWLREIFSDGIPGDAKRVLDLCEVARSSHAAGDIDLALNLLLGAALRGWWADTGPAARARVAEVSDELVEARDDPRHVAVLAVAEPILRGSEVIERLADVQIETIDDPDALRVFGMAAHAVGDQVRAADFLDRAETRLRAQGRLGLLPHVLGMAGSVRLDLGDWSRAAMASHEGREVAGHTGQPVWSTGTLVTEARARGLLGDSASALELSAQADNSPTLRALNDFLACAQLARGYAYITSGRFAEAFEALVRVFDPADPSHHSREQFSGVMFLAEAAVHCGRVPEARTVLVEMERLATITSSPLLHTHLLYARPVLADDDDAESLYLAALRVDLSRWPWVRARIQLAYGTWLRRQRRVAESREPLRSALAALEVIGARVWADQARTELRAAGERRVVGDGQLVVATLSPQEMQIAQLAAEGRSNREIAELLFLSPRTVGSHLYRIFPKLDITSRTQLASRLANI